MGVPPAWAEPTPGPVKDLTAPTVDLHTGVSSLDGTVTVEGTKRGAKARIDATVLFGKDSAMLRPGRPGPDPAGREGVRPEGPGQGAGHRLHRRPRPRRPRPAALHPPGRRRRQRARRPAAAHRLPDDRGRQGRTGPGRPEHVRGEPAQEPPGRHHPRPRRRRQTEAEAQPAGREAETHARPTSAARHLGQHPSASASPSVPESPTPTTAPTDIDASPTSEASSSPGASATAGSGSGRRRYRPVAGGTIRC